MNEFDLAMEELEMLSNITQETVIDRHLQNNSVDSNDLFETNFYKEFWHSFQDSDDSLVRSALDQLINSLQP
jgi:hypothetical protein